MITTTTSRPTVHSIGYLHALRVAFIVPNTDQNTQLTLLYLMHIHDLHTSSLTRLLKQMKQKKEKYRASIGCGVYF